RRTPSTSSIAAVKGAGSQLEVPASRASQDRAAGIRTGVGFNGDGATVVTVTAAPFEKHRAKSPRMTQEHYGCPGPHPTVAARLRNVEGDPGYGTRRRLERARDERRCRSGTQGVRRPAPAVANGAARRPRRRTQRAGRPPDAGDSRCQRSGGG